MKNSHIKLCERMTDLFMLLSQVLIKYILHQAHDALGHNGNVGCTDMLIPCIIRRV